MFIMESHQTHAKERLAHYLHIELLLVVQQQFLQVIAIALKSGPQHGHGYLWEYLMYCR